MRDEYNIRELNPSKNPYTSKVKVTIDADDGGHGQDGGEVARVKVRPHRRRGRHAGHDDKRRRAGAGGKSARGARMVQGEMMR